jgi:glycosyltransferase involved in cell wall biosynthesis
MPVDVLVVDDGSIDGTDTLAKSYGFSVFRHRANRGISAARNSGLQNALSTIVAYCDDDCTPPLDWTERILAAWKDHPGSTIIGGMVEVDHPQTFTQRYLVFRNPLVPAESALANDPSFWYRLSRQFRPGCQHVHAQSTCP